MEKAKVIVVMPAYNAASTLEKTVKDIPPGFVDEIILVDDASIDITIEVAKRLNLIVIEHKENRGYGGNQKTCYLEALKRGADIVIMLHPDYQYDSKLIPYFTNLLKEGFCDIALGSRIRTRKEALENGMPLYKYIGNRFLTLVENIILGQNLSEFHTGYRAYTREVLTTVPFHLNSDRFVFDTQFLVSAISLGFRIGEIPVPVRYMPDASSINFYNSMIYGIRTLLTLLKYILHRSNFKKYPLFQKNENYHP